MMAIGAAFAADAPRRQPNPELLTPVTPGNIASQSALPQSAFGPTQLPGSQLPVSQFPGSLLPGTSSPLGTTATGQPSVSSSELQPVR